MAESREEQEELEQELQAQANEETVYEVVQDAQDLIFKEESMKNEEQNMAEEGDGIDTTEDFEAVFEGKDKFYSWEEFILLFEAFQERSKSVYKPRSATCVSYVNEKRITHKIPERFIYQTVTMICQHYGPERTPYQRARCKPSGRRSVGRNCGAYVRLSYKKGFLHISDKYLIHNNHELAKDSKEFHLRKIRPVIFTDKLDMDLTKAAQKHSVWRFGNSKHSESNWADAVDELKTVDSNFEHITVRMMKKRLRFLMERYRGNCAGRKPLPHDEMGVILYDLITEKDEALATPPDSPTTGRKRKRKYVTRKRGRPSKVAESYEEYLEMLKGPRTRRRAKEEAQSDANEDNNAGDEAADVDDDEDNSGNPEFGRSFKPGKEFNTLVNYLKEKDAKDRKMKFEEIETRREELEIRKEELELQRQKFEQEKEERQALLKLLKSQAQAINSRSPPAESKKSITKEFVLQKDGTLKPLAIHAEVVPAPAMAPQQQHIDTRAYHEPRSFAQEPRAYGQEPRAYNHDAREYTHDARGVYNQETRSFTNL